jgi:hypothetical protein
LLSYSEPQLEFGDDPIVKEGTKRLRIMHDHTEYVARKSFSFETIAWDAS